MVTKELQTGDDAKPVEVKTMDQSMVGAGMGWVSVLLAKEDPGDLDSYLKVDNSQPKCWRMYNIWVLKICLL